MMALDPFTLAYPPNVEATVTTDTCGRVEVRPAERLGVFLCFGQSLAGNHVQGLYQPGPGVQNLNIADGKIYRYVDPCLGATTTPDGHMGWTGYGSIWGLVGDLLIERDLFDRVVFVTPAIGGTEIAKWAPGGVYHHRLLVALRRLVYAGLPLTAVLPMIGESDNVLGTTAEAYTASFMSCVETARNFGFGCPWLVPLETLAMMSVSPALRAAQAAIVDPANLIFAGPDVDAYQGEAYRYLEPGDQRGHLNAAGRDAVAADWADAIERCLAPDRQNAARFAGTGHLLLSGGFANVTDGKVGLLSFWPKVEGGDGAPWRLFSDDTAWRSVLKRVANTWAIRLSNAANQIVLSMDSAHPYTAQSGRHHVLMAWDLATGMGQIYVDDVDDLDRAIVPPVVLDQPIDYTRASWTLGAGVDGIGPIIGSLGPFYLSFSTTLDLSAEANRRRFRTAEGLPVTPDDALLLAATVYCRLLPGESPASFAENRGAGGGFTIIGDGLARADW